MTDYCEFCGKPYEDGQDFTVEFHQVCKDEWYGRLASGKCGYCGKHDRVGGMPWCEECAKDCGAIELHGYAGP